MSAPLDDSFKLDSETRARVAPQYDVDALERLLAHYRPTSRADMLSHFLLREPVVRREERSEYWVLRDLGDATLNELLAEVWQPFWNDQPVEMLEDPNSPYPGLNLARHRKGLPSL